MLFVFVLSIPVGRNLANIVMYRRTRLDLIFDPVDNVIYWLIGRNAVRPPMNWKAYSFHMRATNLFMAVLIYLILVFQDYLPLNPARLPGMEPMLAFNTAISFITNTDWQSYLLKRHIAGRSLGIFGEPRVNVVALNLALQDACPKLSTGARVSASLRVPDQTP